VHAKFLDSPCIDKIMPKYVAWHYVLIEIHYGNMFHQFIDIDSIYYAFIFYLLVWPNITYDKSYRSHSLIQTTLTSTQFCKSSLRKIPLGVYVLCALEFSRVINLSVFAGIFTSMCSQAPRES
jgi:hypothetical protein